MKILDGAVGTAPAMNREQDVARITELFAVSGFVSSGLGNRLQCLATSPPSRRNKLDMDLSSMIRECFNET